VKLADYEILALGDAERWYDPKLWFQSKDRQWLVDMHLLEDDRWRDVGQKAATQVRELRNK
jgi:hypothetical protein